MIPRVLCCGLNPALVEGLKFRLSGLAEVGACSPDDAELPPAASLLVVDGQDSVERSLAWVRHLQSDPHRAREAFIVSLPTSEGSTLLRQLVVNLGAARIMQSPLDGQELLRHIAALLNLPLNLGAGAQAEAPAAPQSINLAEVWMRHREANMARIHSLITSTRELVAGAGHPDPVRRLAHQLAGSLGTFGFERAGLLCRKIELLAHQRVKLLNELAEQVLTLVVQSDQTALALPIAGPEVLTLLMVGGRLQPFQQIANVAAARSVRLLMAATVDSALEIMEREQVDVLLIDLRDELYLGATAALEHRDIPMVGLMDREDWRIRARAQSSGLARFVQDTASAAEILDLVSEVHEQARRQAPKILAVDDDPTILAALETLLGSHRFRVSTLSDPLQFQDKLESVAPELLILDIDLPYLSGLELCRAVRTDPNWNHLPIVFLSSQSEPDEVRRVFRAGGDDYVSKPIVAADLLTRVQNRLLRAQTFRRVSEVDACTGVATRLRSLEAVKLGLRLAGKESTRLTLALLDLDRFRALNESHGRPLGDEILRAVGQVLLRAIRSDDVIGRWSGDQFLLAISSMSTEQAVEKLWGVLDRIRGLDFAKKDGGRFHITASVGLSCFPDHGQDFTTLFRNADQALYRAKQDGRDKLVIYRPDLPLERKRLDVVLVDDDQALVDALLEGLEARGYSARAFSTGTAAVQALSSSLRARVLVLDEHLPDSSGLDVLRRLKETADLASTRVVFLTGLVNEDHTISALDLGAFDYMNKPVAFAVLLRRLERALEP